MINLLPPFEKQKLLDEENWKITFIFGFVVLVFFTSLILILVSINLSVSFQFKAQNVILENKKNDFGGSETQKVVREINQANQNLSNMASFYDKKISMTGFLGKISALLPTGIFLKSISINPLSNKDDSFQVSISGQAGSIEDVISLRDKIKAEADFGDPIFPQETWFQKENFAFNVSFPAIIQQ